MWKPLSRLRDEAEEARQTAISERADAMSERAAAELARAADKAILTETLKKLAYLEEQGGDRAAQRIERSQKTNRRARKNGQTITK
jgi:hypothetical protein